MSFMRMVLQILYTPYKRLCISSLLLEKPIVPLNAQLPANNLHRGKDVYRSFSFLLACLLLLQTRCLALLTWADITASLT